MPVYLRCVQAAVLQQYRCILATFEPTRCVFAMLGVCTAEQLRCVVYAAVLLQYRRSYRRVLRIFELPHCVFAMLGVRAVCRTLGRLDQLTFASKVATIWSYNTTNLRLHLHYL